MCVGEGGLLLVCVGGSVGVLMRSLGVGRGVLGWGCGWVGV